MAADHATSAAAQTAARRVIVWRQGIAGVWSTQRTVS